MVSKTFGDKTGTLNAGDLDTVHDELETGTNALSASVDARLSTVNSRLAALEAGTTGGSGGTSTSLPTVGSLTLKTLSGSTQYVISDSGLGDYTGAEDTSLQSANGSPVGDQPYGSDTSVQVYSWSSGDYGHGLFKFSGLSNISSSAIVSDASITLYCNTATNSNAEEMQMFRVIRAWTEAGATWLKYDGTNAWQTSGALGQNDCDVSTVIATQDVGASSAAYMWQSQSLINLVQGWINGTYTNNGVMLRRNPYDAHTATTKLFTSSEGATAANRPKLTVSVQNTLAEDYSVTVGDVYTVTAPSLSSGSPDDVVTNEYYTVHIDGAVVLTISKTGATDTFEVTAAWAGKSGFVRYHATHAAGSIIKDSQAFSVSAAAALQITAQNTPLSLTVGVALSTQFAPSTGPQLAIISGATGTPVFAISPSVPDGLTFNTSSARLEGTPTTSQTATSYSVSCTDDLTTVNTTVSIAIAAAQPPQTIAFDVRVHGEADFSSQDVSGINVQSCGSSTSLSSIGSSWSGDSTLVAGSSGRISRVQIGGKWYVRQAIHQDDPPTSGGAGYVRTDLHCGGRLMLNAGDVLWGAITMVVPAAIWNKTPGGSSGNWALLGLELHSTNNSQTEMEFWSSKYLNSVSGYRNSVWIRIFNGITTDTDLPGHSGWRIDDYITPDVVTTFIFQEKIDNTGSLGGFFRVWINGTQRVNYSGKTKNETGVQWYPKIPCYNASVLPITPAVSPYAGENAYWFFYRDAAFLRDNAQQYTEPQIRAVLRA